MDVAILEPKEVPDFGTEYVFSAFLPPTSSLLAQIKDHLSSGTQITSPPLQYTHVRDYEGNLTNLDTGKDYVVYFLNERRGTQKRGAYYLPIVGKSNLKRRRTTRGGYAVEDKVDGIELTLRGVSDEEAAAAEKAKREFEEGGPKPVAQEDIEQATDGGEDELSDADAE